MVRFIIPYLLQIVVQVVGGFDSMILQPLPLDQTAILSRKPWTNPTMEGNPEEDHPMNEGAWMPADPPQANLRAHEVRMESMRNPFSSTIGA